MPLPDTIEVIYDRGNDMLFVVDGQPGYFRWSWTGGHLTSPWLQRGSRYEYGEILVRANRHQAVDELLAGIADGRFAGLPDDVLQARAWNRMVDTFDRRIDILRAEIAGHQPGTAAHKRASHDLHDKLVGRRGIMRQLHQAALEENAQRDAQTAAAARAAFARAALTPDAAHQLLIRGGFPVGTLRRAELPS